MKGRSMKKTVRRAMAWVLILAFVGLFCAAHASASPAGMWRTAQKPIPAALAPLPAEQGIMPPQEPQTDPAAGSDTAAESPAGRYDALELSDADLTLLAQIVYLEARGEPYEGQVAVAEVVLNRVLSDAFPDTVSEVIYQRGQFTPAARAASTMPGETQIAAAADAADGLDCVTDADVVYFSGAPCNDAVFAEIGGHWFCRIW